MHWPLIALAALLLAGCRPALDKQLVGEWASGCTIDICVITTLRADHTFTQRFDQKDLDDPVVIGTWRVEGDQLVLHITRQHELKDFPSAVGRDLRYAISQVQPKKLVATSTEARSDPIDWRRIH